ncbi:DUF3347 domain-containing protein [Taibaiella soli]|uniref:DUF3347 domain-containing protein n=1 Tax=Taibaiella soli TaxID=1649169 RepID=A0A2W2A661_9BACT|nr:DUF3347 domain-containing protein [Taibaiella soli]PZF70745.1 hypothetical protein DN068_21750 [Taibaiella soli]
MRKLWILLAAGTFTIASCNNASSDKTASTATEAPKQEEQKVTSQLSEAGTGKLMTVVTDYYSLKDAFVATDAAKADEAAKKLNVSVDSMAAYLKADAAHATAMQPYLDTMKTFSANLSDAKKNENIDKKRASFEKISDAMFAVLKNADLKNAHVYRQFCPMAFDDKGAYWLSNEEEIKNPYFGKKMLECGENRDSLK